MTTALPVGLYFFLNREYALGLLAGGWWSTANIWAIKGLLAGILLNGRFLKVFLFSQLKIPVLYGLGYLALTKLTLNMLMVLAGFHIPIAVFFVMTLLEKNKKAV